MSGIPRPLAPLPIRVRPRPAEITETFLIRLARANHIRPSHLHKICASEPSTGHLQLDRLAVLAGTTPHVLGRTLVNAPSLRLHVVPSPHRNDAENAWRQLVFEIQRDAQGRGLTTRVLAQRHQVSRPIVRRALKTPPPQSSELRPRHLRLSAQVKALITAFLEQGLNRPEIWDRLIDEHDIVVHRPTLAYFVRRWELARDREPPTPIKSFVRNPQPCLPWPLPDRRASN